MKSREQGGVVDSRLNVYGVEGLKVAGMCCWLSSFERMFQGHLQHKQTIIVDLSICPGNVGAVSR